MPDKLILPQGCGLLSFPTPLCRMDGVSSDLGCEVFVKRDDLTGIGFGGNKLRKLDYLIADARQKNCRMLVTSGSLQTNHGMLTAICATKTGLHCVLFLLVEEPDCKKTLSGNLLLDDYIGCDIEFVDVSDIMTSEKTVEEKNRLCDRRLQQKKSERLPFYLQKYSITPDAVYEISSAGSTPAGVMGYVRCMQEIHTQTEKPFDYIFCGNGSGGTFAGLWLGSRIFQPKSRIFGVNIEDMNPQKPRFIADLINTAAARLALSIRAEAEELHFLADSVNAGYALPDKETMGIIEYIAKREGFFLDPVYSAKVFNSALKFIRRNRPASETRVMILHSGGLPGLFNDNMTAYRNQDSSLLDRWNHDTDQ